MKRVSLPPDLKLALPYFLAFLGMIIVGFFAYKISVSEIISQNQKVKSAQSELNVLESKEATLQSIQENILTSADSSLAAVPEANSALVALTQIKDLAAREGLAISNLLISSGSTGESEIKTAQISFDLDGSLISIINFGLALKEMAPLMTLEKIITQGGQSGSTADVVITTYWSELPKNIGSLMEPLGDLNEEEQTLLQKFMTLQKPSFTVLQPEAPSVRADPFN